MVYKLPSGVEKVDTDEDLMNLVIIGHVDSGKSTLTGHLLYDLGEVSKQVIHKYEKMSVEYGKGTFHFAWVMDENEDERQRGVTVDIGIRTFIVPKGNPKDNKFRKYNIIDAPGH